MALTTHDIVISRRRWFLISEFLASAVVGETRRNGEGETEKKKRTCGMRYVRVHTDCVRGGRMYIITQQIQKSRALTAFLSSPMLPLPVPALCLFRHPTLLLFLLTEFSTDRWAWFSNNPTDFKGSSSVRVANAE